jgi:hypothetical protein
MSGVYHGLASAEQFFQATDDGRDVYVFSSDSASAIPVITGVEEPSVAAILRSIYSQPIRWQ